MDYLDPSIWILVARGKSSSQRHGVYGLARMFAADDNIFQLLNVLVGFDRFLNQILEKQA